jgi:Flp pilus assembly protein TadG
VRGHRQRVRRRRGDQRGLSSSTQLAVAFPLLMLLTLGIVQGGLWLHARNVAQRAATAAVDVARGSYGSAGEGEQRARDLAASAGLTDVVVHVDRGAQRVTARVTAHATLVLDLGLGTIEETASGPRERVSTP